MSVESVAMSDRHDMGERRRALLSDEDLERIGEAFDRRQQGLFETIGYDISSAQSRDEIRDDHKFVRQARGAKGKIIGAALAAVGTALGGAALANTDILKILLGSP